MTLRRSIVLLSILLLASCSKQGSTQSQSQSQSNTTDPSEMRIAALSPGIAAMIQELGYEDLIVAKHDYDLALSDQVPPAGSELGFDLEVLIAAQPTHVYFQKTAAERSARFDEVAQEQNWIIIDRPLNTLDDIATTMDDLYYLFHGPPQRETGEYDLEEVLTHTQPSAALAQSWDDAGPIADAAGRVLVLGSVDPIGAMGPGSYHAQIVQRLGAQLAIDEGSMWVEMDYEDLINLNPDSIILIAPKQPSEDDLFGEPTRPTLEDSRAMLGPIASLPICANEHDRIAIIDHPLGLLPSGALSEVASEIRWYFEQWAE